MVKKLALAALLFFIMLLMSSCWDHMELTNMLFVAGVGLDVDESGGVYRASVEIIDIDGDDGKNITSRLVEGEGPTIYEAMQNAMSMTGGIMFSNHCKVVVIGDALSHKGINGVIDIVLRSPSLRKTVDIMLAKGTDARSILTHKTVKSDIVSFELSKILDSNVRTMNNTVKTSVFRLHENLLSGCPASVIPTVSVRKNNGEDFLQIDGAAVFYGDVFRGFLSGEQSKIFRVATNNAERPVISVRDGRFSEEKFDISLKKCRVSLRPYFQDGAPALHMDVRVEAGFEGSAVLNADITDKKTLREIESAAEEQLSRDILLLAEYARSEFGADIFEFYRTFESRCRLEWPSMKSEWPVLFNEMDISITSSVRISGSGLTGNFAPRAWNISDGNVLP